MSLASTLDEMMTPELVGSLAARTGLPAAKTQKGISGAAATVLDGLVNKAHDTTTMNRVVDLVSTTPDEVDADTVLDDNAPLRKGGDALLGMLTRDAPGVASRLAKSVGIGATTAAGLLATAASLAIAALGKIGRAAGGLDASRLSSTLLDEEQAIHAAVPAGVAPSQVRRERGPARPTRSPWWPLVFIALAVFGVWLWTRGGGERHETPAPAPTRREPPRAKLALPEGTVEAQILEDVRSPTLDTTKTFPLDKVEFDANSATLRLGSRDQIARIAHILEANPRVTIEVGGYPDETGTPGEQLSQTRAETVRQALVADGVDASRITTVGHDEPAGTPISIRVTSH